MASELGAVGVSVAVGHGRERAMSFNSLHTREAQNNRQRQTSISYSNSLLRNRHPLLCLLGIWGRLDKLFGLRWTKRRR